LIGLGLHLSYPALIVSAAVLGLANSVYHPADYAILSAHMDNARDGPGVFDPHLRRLLWRARVAPSIMLVLVATMGGLGALNRGRRDRAAGGVLLMVAMGLPDASFRRPQGPPAVQAQPPETSSPQPS